MIIKVLSYWTSNDGTFKFSYSRCSKIGNSARAVLGDMPKHIEIRYYESLLKRIKGMVQTLLLSEVLWATALSIVKLNHP